MRPVYLRCSRGTVSWRYPRGALRVVLTSSGEGNNSQLGSDEAQAPPASKLRGCVKASGPARVYLEGKTSLKLLYSPDDGKHEALHRCFTARGPVAALYVEADVVDSRGPVVDGALGLLTEPKPRVRVHYHLESVLAEEEAECRPCSKDELAKAYCQSDLVARGTVSAVERRPEIDTAEILLRVTKTLRRVEESEVNNCSNAFISMHIPDLIETQNICQPFV